MSYKILTKNGVDNSNIDGARGEYFNTGMRNGITQGALNEGIFIASSSNTISFDTCELRIAGHRVLIDEPVYYTFSNIPNTDTQYSFIAEIVVEASGNVSFSLFPQLSTTELIQNDLYKTINGIGTYQIKIGDFTHKIDGTIDNVIRTIDIITGATGEFGSLEIGEVTTETTSLNTANVNADILYNEDNKTYYLDFDFQIPTINIVQTTGQSTTDVMSQKAITDILGNISTILNSVVTVTETEA